MKRIILFALLALAFPLNAGNRDYAITIELPTTFALDGTDTWVLDHAGANGVWSNFATIVAIQGGMAMTNIAVQCPQGATHMWRVWSSNSVERVQSDVPSNILTNKVNPNPPKISGH